VISLDALNDFFWFPKPKLCVHRTQEPNSTYFLANEKKDTCRLIFIYSIQTDPVHFRQSKPTILSLGFVFSKYIPSKTKKNKKKV